MHNYRGESKANNMKEHEEQLFECLIENIKNMVMHIKNARNHNIKNILIEEIEKSRCYGTADALLYASVINRDEYLRIMESIRNY